MAGRLEVSIVERTRWEDLSARQRAVIGVVGVVQISLAIAAWVDLFRRAPEEVNGPKALWALVIAVNFVGPLAYFRWGRRAVASDAA